MEFTKYVLPVVVGSMSGMILITAGEVGIHNLYPLPPGTDLHDPESLARVMAQMPVNAFILLLLNYIVCSFLSGLIAALVSGRVTVRPSFIVGLVLTLAGLYNTFSLPHPLWFSILNILVYLPMAWLGYLVVKRKATGSQPEYT
jgi:hypothetical protein